MASVVEGVGDELVWTFSVLCMVLLVVLVRRCSQAFQMEIHPESRENVQTARSYLQRQEQMGEGERPEPTAPPDNGRSSLIAQQIHRRQEGDSNCPICIAALRFPVETNCGHIFCGMCMVSYWEHGHWLGAVRCPICRQNVTIMLLCFNEEEQRDTSQEKQSVINEIRQYNRRFSGEPRTLIETLQDLPMLLRHCIAEFFSVGGLVWMFRMRLIVLFLIAFIYFISPLDIIPEAAFGILGLIDDLFIVLLLAIYISVLYRNYAAGRA